MKFNLNGNYAFVIKEEEKWCIITDCKGFIMPAEQMIEVAEKMIIYATKNKNEIEVYNKKRQIEYDKEVFVLKNRNKKNKTKR